MLNCLFLALSGVNWEMMYQEIKYWKMKLHNRKG